MQNGPIDAATVKNVIADADAAIERIDARILREEILARIGFGYVDTRGEYTPAREKELAELVAQLCARELDIPMPSIKWFRGTRNAERPEIITLERAAGAAQAGVNVIWLRCSRSGAALVSTVAHECCHIAQDPDMPICDMERDAEQYAEDFFRRLFS